MSCNCTCTTCRLRRLDDSMVTAHIKVPGAGLELRIAGILAKHEGVHTITAHPVRENDFFSDVWLSFWEESVSEIEGSLIEIELPETFSFLRW